MLNPNLPTPSTFQHQFVAAKPFKHLCIDDFLIPSIAEQLLSEFPPFDSKRALNEMGKVGGKATREDVKQLGPGFASLDECISAPAFLRTISLITGIPDLAYDPSYFGGGTHDNQHGQELDPHVDFNYNQQLSLHRRLNLIIYLNKNWDAAWGGEIELHSNPREPDTNSIISFAPLFNRCVIFETTESSWHGFPVIKLPPEARNISRKSFAIYLYSKERPPSEIAPPHRTFYISRPPPPHLKAGHTMTKEDELTISHSIRRRDQHIHMYQKLELELSAQVQGLTHHLKEIQSTLRCNTLGYVTQIGLAEGYSPDKWINGSFKASFSPVRMVDRCELRLLLPVKAAKERRIEITIGSGPTKQATIPFGAPVIISIDFEQSLDSPFTVEITGETFTPLSLGLNNDDRPLLCQLECLTFFHK
jgi:Rps23 Pro-64 3,4-dihydroxylase Tpa1-like proline 4-hydroxylase